MNKPTRMEELRNELLADIAAHVLEILQDHSIGTDIAEQCGAAIADHLADNWGGQVVSIPKDHAYKLAKRDVAILREFTGNNHSDLARRYDMTERGIRKLVTRAIQRQRDLFQGKLFGE